MELVKTNVTFTKPTINYDLGEIKTEIERLNSLYGNLIIKEDDIPNMKKEIAQINKIKKAISTKRIDTVKEITEPIKTFESELKGFEKTLTEMYSKISEQVKTFENEQKQARKEEIMQWDEFKVFMVFEERWLNKSTSDNSIKADIQNQQMAYDNNVKLIESTCNLAKLESGKYIQMLNNKAEINEIITLMQNDKDLLETYDKIEEETKTIEIEKTFTTEVLTISCGVNQMKELKEYMTKNGIEFYN